jgi:hypothetical protein
MKRLMGVLFAASLASGAVASVGFDFGAQFYFPRLDPNGADENWSGQGQSFEVAWGVDNGLALGAYGENTDLSDGTGGSEIFTVQAITITKTIVKNADIGLRIGSFFETENDLSGLVTDIAGRVTIISGSGDKVSGTVKASAGGRWADNGPNGGENWSGWFLNLSVGIWL